ncbi:MAG: PEP/pyruvate-binding domain-containing protein [Acidobacteriota bacterium]
MGWSFRRGVDGLLARAARRRPPAAPGVRDAAFRLTYERFREILSYNDVVLGLIADLEDALAGRRPFSLDVVRERVRSVALDAFVMVKNLDQLAGGAESRLYDALERIDGEINALWAATTERLNGPLLVPLAALRAGDAQWAGTKMANLGEVANRCGLATPVGFVITTVATSRFLSENGLWERCDRLEAVLEEGGPSALGQACEEVGGAIERAVIPAEVVESIAAGIEMTFGSRRVRLAVRSSAVGEDSAESSHAGLYATLLDIAPEGLPAAWRSVVASAFSPVAVTYRYERGLSPREAQMAVGCVEMVQARCAGVAYSRPPDDPASDVVVIGATSGAGAALAAGETSAETLFVVPGREARAGGALLGDADLRWLVSAARGLEGHFGSAQDIEWAVDVSGNRFVLQSRPVVAFAPPPVPCPVTDRSPLLAGGNCACPGVGSGPVFVVRGANDLPSLPQGGVLVAHHSSPTFVSVMRRCAAIVTDVGSPTGHMASLAREFGVPALVGLEGATGKLRPGQVVTVDASGRRVYEGDLPLEGAARPIGPSDSPALEKLRALASFVTPLGLTDPSVPGFAPEECRSLHDLTRYVHERAYETVFHFGDLAREDRHHSFKLDARLPIVVRVFDVGGGVTLARSGGGRVRVEEISSVPFRALLDGMLEPRIRWDLPRPVSVRGFLSVLGESMAGPPAETLQIGRLSYAIVSDCYLNFSTKAGYHFQTVDAYCGESQNKNYVHFRFKGGAADEMRRQRRIRFVSAVLEALDFRVDSRSDLVHARLDKYPGGLIAERLVDLGHLTMCARQLDMLMDADESADHFAAAFLAGLWERF